MATLERILLVNDKDYKVVDGVVTCAVNYNEFFVPLQEYFQEVHVVGRMKTSGDPYPFLVSGFQFHGVPSYDTYVEFVKRYRFGPDGKVATDVLRRAVACCDAVLLTVGCFFAADVERVCREMHKPLVVEVIDDVLTAVNETKKYRGLARLVARWMAWRMDRYYRALCGRVPSLILGRDLYERYRPLTGPRCMEFFENIMEEGDYSFGRKLFQGGKIRILFVGRLVHMKAVEDLICAVKLLRDRGKAVECRIVGYGELLGSLRQQVSALDLDREITFSGFVKYGPDMFSVYDWADVFVLTSVGGEGVPRVLIEALARGCLVVATDVCGISTIIKDERTGLLVPPRSPQAVARAIERLSADPELVKRLLSEAMQFCLEHTRGRQIRRLVDLVREAAAQERT
jgi:glycosyltransferase involved in cell wall biosynthesis